MKMCLSLSIHSTFFMQKIKLKPKKCISPVPGISGFHTLHTVGQDCKSCSLYEELSIEVSYREIRVLEVEFFLV